MVPQPFSGPGQVQIDVPQRFHIAQLAHLLRLVLDGRRRGQRVRVVAVVGLDVVNDGPEPGLAERTDGPHVGPLDETGEAKLVHARIGVRHVLQLAQADGAVGLGRGRPRGLLLRPGAGNGRLWRGRGRRGQRGRGGRTFVLVLVHGDPGLFDLSPRDDVQRRSCSKLKALAPITFSN